MPRGTQRTNRTAAVHHGTTPQPELAETTVTVEISADVKERAARNLAAMELTMADAIRMLLVRIAEEPTLPFAARVPNAKTVAALEEAEHPEHLPKFDSIEALMDDLNAEN